MKQPQMSVAVSRGVRSDTAPLPDGTEGWGACSTLVALTLPKSPGHDSPRLRLWFPVPPVPCSPGDLAPLLHTDILSPLSAISLKAVSRPRGPFANEERRKQPDLHLSH